MTMSWLLLLLLLIVSAVSPSSSSTCSSSAAAKEALGRKSTLPLFHRHSPCNPRYSVEDRLDHNELHRMDNERVDYINSMLHTQDSQLASGNVTLPVISGNSIGVLNYLVNISIGTPRQNLTMVIDTGSSLVWTQCEPCSRSCYSQVDPIFHPSLSSSYKNISCRSATCTQISNGTSAQTTCNGSTCTYSQTYGDQSYSYGFYATETLTLSTTDNIKNFQFGCGQDNGGHLGKADGLIGLGRKEISLVKQTATQYGEIFSYCLPDISGSLGYLRLGNAGGSPAEYTPMVTLSQPMFYGINLTGISVGGKQLSIPQSVFSNPGTIIDSGTAFTRLQRTAYDAFQNAFQQGMSNYPRAPASNWFNTCYDLSSYDHPSIPSVEFIFHGDVRLNLQPNNLLYSYSDSQSCLAILETNTDSDMGIYGNTQQEMFEVIYDLPGQRIGFAPNGC